MNKEKLEVFKNAPVSKAVISNIIPSIVSMLMVLVYNLADTFFIGQTKNALMVTAVSVATPAFIFFMAVGMLFGIGGTSLISRLLGEKNLEKAKNTSAFCFWTGTTIGVISMIIMLIFTKPICLFIGASSETLDFTLEYVKIVAFGIPFLIVSNSFSNIIRAEGNALIAMAGMIIGNLVNIVLDPIMILSFGWNVKGAAIATVLGNISSALIYIIYIISKKSMLTINPKFYKIKNHVATGVFAIGIPASINSILLTTSNILINKFMYDYGDLAIAGLGVAMKVNMIVIMLLIGVGTGIQPLLGYCYGAGNKKRYLEVLKFSVILAFTMSMILTVICYCGARPLVETFLDDKEAISYGMQFARIYIYSGPIMGILFVFINAIQATGAAIPALVLSVSRQGIVYIPVLFILKSFNNAKLLASAQPISDYCAVTLAVVLFIFTYKKHISKIQSVDKTEAQQKNDIQNASDCITE